MKYVAFFSIFTAKCTFLNFFFLIGDSSCLSLPPNNEPNKTTCLSLSIYSLLLWHALSDCNCSVAGLAAIFVSRLWVSQGFMTLEISDEVLMLKSHVAVLCLVKMHILTGCWSGCWSGCWAAGGLEKNQSGVRISPPDWHKVSLHSFLLALCVFLSF